MGSNGAATQKSSRSAATGAGKKFTAGTFAADNAFRLKGL